MTRLDAMKILGLCDGFSPRERDEAYRMLRSKHLIRAQHAIDPRERYVATTAQGLIQDAYRELAGKPPPASLPGTTNPAARKADDIIRVSLAKTASRRSHAGSSSGRSSPAGGLWRERLVAAFIWGIMVLVGILLVAKGIAKVP
jgi:hypothetical protein